MLTPAFEIHQDADFLTFTIKAPFTKVSEVETFVEGKEFKFYSKPYYLRLCLPGELVEDGRETASYDADSGVFTVRVPKATPGEEFSGLDMLTKLLAPSGQVSAKQPLIEVIGGDDPGAAANGEEEEEFDWFIDQQPYDEGEVTIDGPKYGFANTRSGVFSRLKSELGLIVDLDDPDTTPAAERSKLRIAKEDDKFDDDHYLADLYGDDVIQELLRFTPPWCEELQVAFTEGEKDQLRKFSNKEYLLDEGAVTSVYLCLVDIMFAYCYNLRTTEGENTVESAWTLCKLSSTLSWLDSFSSLKDVVVASFRRCLCFPLYRHWHLALTVYEDLTRLFSVGKRQILKNLLQVHHLLQESEPYYVLNDLYITDLCVWLQGASDKRIASLSQALQKMEMKKADLGFHLDELETAAESVILESEMESVSDNLAKVTLTPRANRNAGYKGTHCGSLPVRDSDDDSTDTDDVSTIGNDETTESDDEASSSDYTGNFANSRHSMRYIGEIHTQADV